VGRCFGDGDPLYEAYHDDEWGRPVTTRDGLFERICLEAFQSGLAWITILRKREGFRRAFAGFDPEAVARFEDDDVERLLLDAAIVRNRAKIEAAIGNARAIVALEQAGDDFPTLLWSFAPPERAAPPLPTEIPSSTPESTALARELKRRGFRFVGPTTAYALMQAAGLVDDHLADCPVRDDVEAARRAATPPTR
jgi:DNA-3-methyladenine glycosylase I